MLKYKLISEPRVLEGTNYTAYGIKASDGTIISDISNDKVFVKNLITDIKKKKIRTNQLRDVVEEAISQ